MLPKPPEKGLKFTMRSYLIRSLFPLPETYGDLVVESRMLVSTWTVAGRHQGINCACDLFGSDREGQFASVAPAGAQILPDEESS